MDSLKIIIVDDHPLFATGLKSLLAKQEAINVVSVVDSYDMLLEQCKSTNIDLVLMDIELGENCGIKATQQIKTIYPNIKVLAFSGHEEEKTIRKMMAAGASGYLTKNANIDELIQAIQQVSKSHLYLSTSISRTLLQNKNLSNNNTGINSKQLTERELQILNFVVKEELSNKEIAERLYISPRTVETHKRNLIQKLKVRNVIGLAKYYFKQFQLTAAVN